MSEVVNLRHLKPGMKLALTNGATLEVVENPGDGIWIFGRYLAFPEDPKQEGVEEMVFAQDIVRVLETP
jgi:hypothetical protein